MNYKTQFSQVLFHNPWNIGPYEDLLNQKAEYNEWNNGI